MTGSASTAPLPRAVTILLGLAAAVVVVAGMRAVAWLLGPTLLALVLTVAAQPLRVWLDRRMPRWLATVLTFTVIVVGLLALLLSLFVAAARFVSLVPDYQDDADELVGDVTDWLGSAGVSEDEIHTVAGGLDLAAVADAVSTILSGVAGFASLLVLLVSLLLFLAVDGATFPARLADAAAVRPRLMAALDGFAHSTRRYLVVSTVFGLIVAVIDTAALALMGVPAPLVWGLLAFLTNYIPNIGFVIGLLPPALLALLEGGPDQMLAVIAVYCVVNVVIQSVIQPKVVGDAVGLSTTLTFVSLVLWAWVLGPLGAVLAIPLSLLVRAVLVDADPASGWLAPLVANSDQVGGDRSVAGDGDDLDHVETEGSE